MIHNFAISREYRNKALSKDGYSRAIEIDTKKSSYMGKKWKDLGSFGKRKFENAIVLKQVDRVKILYT